MDREKIWMIAAGVIIGGLAVLLVAMGNPGNMGFCIACFLRDTAGGLGFHRAAVVQYVRPELIGLVIGAFIAAVGSREFKSRGGSSTLVRFLLGVFMMIGALVFLGCPLRAILRIGGGDLNAVVGLAGLITGILGKQGDGPSASLNHSDFHKMLGCYRISSHQAIEGNYLDSLLGSLCHGFCKSRVGCTVGGEV